MNNMEVIKYSEEYFQEVVVLLASFRVHLKSLKGVNVNLDIESAKEELTSFINDVQYPIYLCVDDNKVLGYMILKVDGVIWVEQLFAKEEYRQQGVASLLYQQAETINNEIGEDTLFVFVHPNNEAMIAFLKSKGYTVLNLIEVRKPFKEEKLTTKIDVNNHQFDY